MSRWIRFFIAILVGIALGLLYGWMLNPIEYVDTAPDTLRVDYKTDYVLMVAETFHLDGNLQKAEQRLALLGSASPLVIVQQALQFAAKAGYTATDLALIQALSEALQNTSGAGSSPETPIP